MTEKTVYLDTSAIIKRYVYENGSEVIRAQYREAYNGNVMLLFSLWNIGELLGVFDKANRQKKLTEEQMHEGVSRFSNETARLRKIGRLSVVPISERIVEGSWDFVTKYHIYQADALQISSALETKCNEFFTGDQKLHSVTLSEGLNSSYLG
jgi:predicted nucleic acid-binding protein